MSRSGPRGLLPAGLLLALWFLSGPPARSQTDVYIGIEGKAEARPAIVLALPPFIPDSGELSGERHIRESALLASRVWEVVHDDLQFSRHFKLLTSGPPAADPDSEASMEHWKKLGAQSLLVSRAAIAETKVSLSVTLYDLGSGKTILKRQYRQEASFFRSAAHQVSDDAVRALTGRPGIASTRIAFSNNRTGSKEIYLVDYDGENLRRLTSDESINLLPRFSPDGKALLYTSYQRGNPDLFRMDLTTGKTGVLSHEQGLNIPGGFTPDGNRLALTLSRNRDPNIYVLDLRDRSLKRLTSSLAVESSPTFSPDGSRIAFVSDRAGNPQVYLMDAETGRTQKLTRLNWCDTPSWSPSGAWIAFSGRVTRADPMDIYLVDVTGSQVVQLTHGEGSNEDPAWSPDGRFLAFTTTRGGRKEIYVMDADGSAPHRLADIPGGSFTPSWSP